MLPALKPGKTITSRSPHLIGLTWLATIFYFDLFPVYLFEKKQYTWTFSSKWSFLCFSFELRYVLKNIAYELFQRGAGPHKDREGCLWSPERTAWPGCLGTRTRGSGSALLSQSGRSMVYWWDGYFYKKEATLAHSYLDEMGMHVYSKSCTTLSRFILTPRTGVGQVNSRTIFCAASSKIITWEQNWCENYPIGAKSKHFLTFPTLSGLLAWHNCIECNQGKTDKTK